MLALLLAPAVLSSLVLAAHFLRRGQVLPFIACFAMAAFPAVRLPWVRRVWQGVLGLGVLVWLQALSQIARTRIEAGESWQRPAFILGGVAAFTVLSALLLEHRRVYAAYQGGGGAPSTP